MKPKESGFTLIELLVGMGIFAVVSVAFFQVMLGARSGAQTARDISAVSGEARLGFNRMVRDTREASTIKSTTPSDSANPTSFQIWIDFNNNGQEDAAPSDLTGSHEVVTYSWNSVQKTISITSGTNTEVLIRGVDCVRAGGACLHPVFTLTSNRLEFDTNPIDGVTTRTELQAAPGIGVGADLAFIDQVTFSLSISEGDTDATIYTKAQLRNLR